MTVAELTEELKSFPPHAKILVDMPPLADGSPSDHVPVMDIRPENDRQFASCVLLST